MNEQELRQHRTDTIFVWVFMVGLWATILLLNTIWYDAPKEDTLFVFSVVVFVTTSVCLPPFLYVVYKLGELK